MLRGTKILYQNKFILRCDCLARMKHSNEGIKINPFGQIFSRSSFHQLQTMFDNQWGLKEKYISKELNEVHHTNTQESNRNGVSFLHGCKIGAANFYFHIPERSALSLFSSFNPSHFRKFHTTTYAMDINKDFNKNEAVKKNFLQRIMKTSYHLEKLKMATEEYGQKIVLLYFFVKFNCFGIIYFSLFRNMNFSSVLDTLDLGDEAGILIGILLIYGLNKVLSPVCVSLTLTIASIFKKKLKNQVIKAPSSSTGKIKKT